MRSYNSLNSRILNTSLKNSNTLANVFQTIYLGNSQTSGSDSNSGNVDLSSYALKTYVDGSLNYIYTNYALANGVYTKSYIDTSFSSVYTKSYIDTSFSGVYTKSYIDTSFSGVYTKSYIDTSFSGVYTKSYIDTSFNSVYTKSYIDTSFSSVYTKSYIDTSFSGVYTKSYIDTSFSSVYTKSYIDTSFSSVYTQLNALTNGAPETLNTLAEISTAISGDASFGIVVYGKIASSDLSINELRIKNTAQDSSINLLSANSGVRDPSMNILATYNDTQDSSINLIITKNTAQDSSINLIITKNTAQDSSINLLSANSGVRDPSMNILATYNDTQDSSINLITIKNTAQDSSINLLTTSNGIQDSSINLLTTSNGIQDSSINLLTISNGIQDSSINLIITKNTAQDSSINLIITKNTAQDSSINLLTTSNSTQDSSINQIYNLDVSFNGNIRLGFGNKSIAINKDISTNFALDISGSTNIVGNLSVTKKPSDANYSYFDLSSVNLSIFNTIEKFTTVTFNTTTMTLNYSLGSIFYTTATANFAALVITNVPTTLNRSITVTLITSQSGTFYFTGTAVSVNGTSITYIKQDGTAFAVPSASRTLMVYQFNIIFASATPTIIGTMAGFS